MGLAIGIDVECSEGGCKAIVHSDCVCWGYECRHLTVGIAVWLPAKYRSIRAKYRSIRAKYRSRQVLSIGQYELNIGQDKF